MGIERQRPTSAELKRRALKALAGNFTTPVVALLVLSMLISLANGLSAWLFGGDTVMSNCMGQLFGFILDLLVTVLAAGLNYIYLKISRGEASSIGDLPYLFFHQPDRAIIVAFVLALVQDICMLPGTLYLYRVPMPPRDQIEALGQYMSVLLVLALAGWIVSWLITLPFTFSYYLLIDNEQMKAGEALRRSRAMMRGNYMRYIRLMLSFLGWFFAACICCYVGLLWLVPYMGVAETEFYRDLMEEAAPEEEPPAEFSGLPRLVLPEDSKEQEKQPQQPSQDSDDDYNAEA